MKLNIMTKAQMEKYMDRLVRKLGDKINDEIYILRKIGSHDILKNP